MQRRLAGRDTGRVRERSQLLGRCSLALACALLACARVGGMAPDGGGAADRPVIDLGGPSPVDGLPFVVAGSSPCGRAALVDRDQDFRGQVR